MRLTHIKIEILFKRIYFAMKEESERIIAMKEESAFTISIFNCKY